MANEWNQGTNSTWKFGRNISKDLSFRQRNLWFDPVCVLEYLFGISLEEPSDSFNIYFKKFFVCLEFMKNVL